MNNYDEGRENFVQMGEMMINYIYNVRKIFIHFIDECCILRIFIFLYWNKQGQKKI